MRAYTDASGDVHLVMSGDTLEAQGIWAVLDHSAVADFGQAFRRRLFATKNEVLVGNAVRAAAAALDAEMKRRIERCAQTGTANQSSQLTSTER